MNTLDTTRKIPIVLKYEVANIIILALLFIITHDLSNNWTDFRQKDYLLFANVGLILVYIWAIYSWVRINKNLASLYLFFLVASLFFNAGQTILQFFPDPGYLYINIYKNYSEHYINKMLTFQMLCIISMNSGAFFSYNLLNKHKTHITTTPSTILNNQNSKMWDILFYISSIVMIINDFSQLRLRMQYSYSEYYELRDSVSIFISAAYFLTFAVYILRHPGDKREQVIAKYIVFIQVGLSLIISNRTNVIAILAEYLFLMVITKNIIINKKKWPKYFLISVSLIIVSGIISIVRTQSISNMLDNLTSINNGSIFKMLGQSIHEMGMSAQTVILTILANDRGVQHQQTILYNLAESFFPHGILDALGIFKPSVGKLSAWVTSISGGYGSGLGYSYIAEAYFDFGMYGFLFTGIYGFAVALLELISIKMVHKGKLFFPSLIVYILANQIFFARAQFDLVTGRIRIVVYLLIIYVFVMLVRNRTNLKTSAKNGELK